MDSTITPGIFSSLLQPQQDQGATPTPQQIQAAYAQANAMKGQGLTTEPVHAWTQGVNQMLKALAGRYMGSQADALQRQYQASGNIPGGGAVTPGPAPYMPVTQMPPQAGIPSAPASTYGAGVPYLYGAGVPGGIGGQ